MSSVLILRDQTNSVLIEMLEKLQQKVIDSCSVHEVLEQIRCNNIDLIFVDQQKTAIDSLRAIKEKPSLNSIPVVIITSRAKSDEVIEAMRLGAFDHLNKPLSFVELSSVLNKILSKPKENNCVDPNLDISSELIGTSTVMRQVEKLTGIAAGCEATVLIIGDTGTGKDTVARLIHKHSRHSKEPLTVIDCTAVPEDYDSFQSLSPGGIGTVILDEIGDLNQKMQAMLVRALKESTIEARLDSLAKLRIIATTQYDLVNMVREKCFREDLYFRLNVLPIILPPLKERGADVIALAELFLAQANPQKPKQLSEAAANVLTNYGWTGNVRELQNLIYHLNATVQSLTIEKSDLGMIIQKDNLLDDSELDYYHATATLEKRLIIKALKEANGSRSEAARILGINRQLLYSKLKTHGLMD